MTNLPTTHPPRPLPRAIPSYDEAPRTSWILRHSAQATVAVSRTFFTQEVNEAFDELEEGNEDALKAEYERQVGVCGLVGHALCMHVGVERVCCSVDRAASACTFLVQACSKT
jgi:hypothetical protein